MNDKEIRIGLVVEVDINGAYCLGTVKQISPPYQLSNEKRYEVHGVGKKSFVTITSARSMRACWTDNKAAKNG